MLTRSHVLTHSRVIASVSGHGLLSDTVFASKLFRPNCLLCLAYLFASNVLNAFTSFFSSFEGQFVLRTISTKVLRYFLELIIVSSKTRPWVTVAFSFFSVSVSLKQS